MDAAAKLGALIELAESCGMSVRHVPAAGGCQQHPGGALVRLKGREILFLDPMAPPAEQIDVVASALANKKELDDRFLPPEIREVIAGASPA